MDDFADNSLSLTVRAAACRGRANELLDQAAEMPPEVGDELRTLALQWLVLAKQLEARH